MPEKAFSVCIKDSVLLEPACGNGNFLVEILRRKLRAAKRLCGDDPGRYEAQAMLAVTSIYGIDLLMDNVIESRQRMYDVWAFEAAAVCGDVSDRCGEVIKMVIHANILCGNFLTM